VNSYDPETGVFRWLRGGGHGKRIGGVAGSARSMRYRRIMVACHTYAAHRLAWLYVYGAWPKGQLDHVNCIKDDNRISNLRECSPTQNRANSHGVADHLKGAFRTPYGKWKVEIGVKGKNRYLGTFDNPEDAALAHATVSYALYGEFARPHWRSVLQEIRGAGWRKPQIEELSLSREEMGRVQAAVTAPGER
jgi:hypothetical protein